MLETPRKRTFGSIHSPASPNSSTRQRDQDNPWFRDPSHQDKEHKARKNEHTSSPDLVTLISGQDHLPQTSSLNTQSLKEQEPIKSSATVPEDDTVEDGEIAEEEPPPKHSPSPSRRSQSVKSDRDRRRDRESDRERHRDHDRSSVRHRQRDTDRDRPRERTRERRDDSRERDYGRDSHRERERRKDRDRDHDRFAHPPPPSYSDHKRSPDRDRDHPRRRLDQDERSSRYHREDHHRRDSDRRSTDNARGSTDHHSRRPSTSHKPSKAQDDDGSGDVNDEVTGVAEQTPQLTEDEILEQARRKRAEILAKHKQLNQTVNPSNVFTMTTDPSLPAVHNPLTDLPNSSTSSVKENLISTKANHFPHPPQPTPKLLTSIVPLLECGLTQKLLNRPGSDQNKALVSHLTHVISTISLHYLARYPVEGVRYLTNSQKYALSDSVAGSPEPVAETNFDLTQDANNQASTTAVDDEESVVANHPLDQQTITGRGHQSISAADYNPDDDRRIDNERQNEKQTNGHRVPEQPASDIQPGANLPGSEEVNGMDGDESDDDGDDDDDDDMFAIDSTEKKTRKKKSCQGSNPRDPSNLSAPFLPVINRAGTDAEVVDNFDDADVIIESYWDMSTGKDGIQGSGSDVAIKVVQSSQKEASILKKLQEADPGGKYHIIRLERTFEHRGHLCLVFEAMSMNLREVGLRTSNVSGSLTYEKCNIMHADLKPDNILVCFFLNAGFTDSQTYCGLFPLSNPEQLFVIQASDVTENEITPYLVSRFYRAPEIILGLPYDCSIDIWSIGCTLYELYTGKIFISRRLNSQCSFDDEKWYFLSMEKNRITGTDVVKSINIPNKPAQGLQSRLMPNHVTKKMQDADKILTLEPSRRISPKEALNHHHHNIAPPSASLHLNTNT
ncbi:hypothetical protein KEM48_014074 [Puccinia striiformis f. sp. tritici PST-130]|nr:hypothetical protein KEM48_014074 [Puccinia striiformis f. sp. tritici PST-130]